MDKVLDTRLTHGSTDERFVEIKIMSREEPFFICLSEDDARKLRDRLSEILDPKS